MEKSFNYKTIEDEIFEYAQRDAMNIQADKGLKKVKKFFKKVACVRVITTFFL